MDFPFWHSSLIMIALVIIQLMTIRYKPHGTLDLNTIHFVLEG